MKIEQNQKKTVKGFPIYYPSNIAYGKPSVFKIYFGRKFLIWKGKSFYQSIENIGVSIRAAINKGNHDETHYMYHVVAHILKNGMQQGVCKHEDIFNDFSTPTRDVDGYKMLIVEQEMIDEAINSSLCLNNNVQAYVPDNSNYITQAQKEKFLRWYEKTHK